MSQPPVFPKEIHHPRPPIETAKPAAKPHQGGKTSRDVREDRAERQIKTTQPQTFPHKH